jgi:regulator of sigma E protease
VAGPLTNIIFAILFFTVIYWIGFNEYSYENEIILISDLETVQPATPHPADVAGLKTGDKVISINGRLTRHFGEIKRELAFTANQALPLTVERKDGDVETLTITPRLDPNSASGVIGITVYTEPIIQGLSDKAAALNDWLIPGVRITAVDGKPVMSNFDILMAFRDKPEYLPVTIERDGKSITRNFRPEYTEGAYQSLGLGFAAREYRTPRYHLGQAFIRGGREFVFSAYSIVHFFIMLPQHINVGRVIGGPLITTVTIGRYTSSGLEQGFGQGLLQFIQLLCMLSTILALMNLLPLPVLDGGFIILFFIEWLRRKPFRPKFIYRFQMVGIGLLGVLFIVVLFNDVFRLFGL